MISGIVLAGGLLPDGAAEAAPSAPGTDPPPACHRDGRRLGAGRVVLGHAADEIRTVLRLPLNGRVVVNPDYASGQTSSLRTGLGAVAPASQAAVVLLGDQPDVTPETVRLALDLYRRTGGPVVRAFYEQQPGHPVVFDRRVLEAGRGERG